jgi:hypothetical protein
MMRSLTIISILVVYCVCVAAQATENKWIEYKSTPGRYSVMLPSEPKITKQNTTAANGDPLVADLATATEGQMTLIIGYFDYSGTYSFDDGRNGILEKTGGKLISETNIKLGTFPGRDLVVDASGGGYDFRVYVRYYDAGDRVYLLQFLVLKKDDTAANAIQKQKYFDSFKILPKS